MSDVERLSWGGFGDDIPDLAPIVATEPVRGGWRGITSEGEVYDVAADGSEELPDSILMARGNALIGRRRVDAGNVVDVTAYTVSFAAAVAHHREGRDDEALAAIEDAIAIVSTARAHVNRAMILLSLGRWREGFEEYEACERRPPFERPRTRGLLASGLAPWRGESVAGRRLLVVHDHGFGDTIMMLRYVPALVAMGASVVLDVPPELARIAGQFAAVDPPIGENERGPRGVDFFTSFLQLAHWLSIEPGGVPRGAYVKVDPVLQASWRDQLGRPSRRRVGVAWSVGDECEDDYPRSLPLEEVVRRHPDAELHSVQRQGADEATTAGVVTHDLVDFASAAALMSVLDEVVSVDTAAIHVAGAIGHPRATLLLSRWHSWRWRGNPFYPGVKIEASGR